MHRAGQINGKPPTYNSPLHYPCLSNVPHRSYFERGNPLLHLGVELNRLNRRNLFARHVQHTGVPRAKQHGGKLPPTTPRGRRRYQPTQFACLFVDLFGRLGLGRRQKCLKRVGHNGALGRLGRRSTTQRRSMLWPTLTPPFLPSGRKGGLGNCAWWGVSPLHQLEAWGGGPPQRNPPPPMALYQEKKILQHTPNFDSNAGAAGTGRGDQRFT